MGRHTYEQVLTFDPWPYGERKVVVLSSRPVAIPEALAASVVSSSEAPAALLERLGREGARQVYVDGGKTIQGFLAEGLIQQITITVIPVLLGSGRPLFASGGKAQQLRLVSSTGYEFGFVQSTYHVLADA